jgi:hypothetical protein
MPSVANEPNYAKYRYAECSNADCHGATIGYM